MTETFTVEFRHPCVHEYDPQSFLASIERRGLVILNSELALDCFCVLVRRRDGAQIDREELLTFLLAQGLGGEELEVEVRLDVSESDFRAQSGENWKRERQANLVEGRTFFGIDSEETERVEHPMFRASANDFTESAGVYLIKGRESGESLALDLARAKAVLKTKSGEVVVSLASVVTIVASYSLDSRWSSDEPLTIVKYSIALRSHQACILEWTCEEDYPDRFGSSITTPVPFRALVTRLADSARWRLELGLPEEPGLGSSQSAGCAALGCLGR